MPLAEDGQDGNGLQLENKKAQFFMFLVYSLCIGKITKN